MGGSNYQLWFVMCAEPPRASKQHNQLRSASASTCPVRTDARRLIRHESSNNDEYIHMEVGQTRPHPRSFRHTYGANSSVMVSMVFVRMTIPPSEGG